MKFLILILFITPAFSQELAPNCQELSKILQSLEQDLAMSSITNVPGGCNTYINQEIPENQKGYFDEKKCDTLNTIETELRSLENQEGILKGLQRLRLDIQASLDKTKKTTGLAAAIAGEEFVQKLNIGQSFETILRLDIDLRLKFESEIKGKDIDTAEEMKAQFFSFCNNPEIKSQIKPGQHTFCEPGLFNPSDAAVKELNLYLHEFASPVSDEISKAESKKREEEALSNKDSKGDPVSFTEMTQKLVEELSKSTNTDEKTAGLALAKLTKDESQSLSRDELKAVQKLGSFTKDHDALKNKISSERYKFLLDDIKKRQELEIRSKASILISQYGTKLSSDQQLKCAKTKSDINVAKDCLELLDQSYGTNGTAETDVHKGVKALSASLLYLNTLQEMQNKCTGAEKNPLPDICSNPDFNVEDFDSLYKNIHSLNLIRAQIISENKKQADLKNFTLATMMKMDNCLTSEQTEIEFCEAEPKLNTEAISLSSDILDISIVIGKSNENSSKPDISEICKTDGKNHDEKRLCAVLTGPPASETPLEIPKKENKEEEVFTTPGKREESSIADKIGSVFGFVQQVLASPSSVPPIYPMIPPPGFASPYANGGGGAMSISDRILAPAVFQGGFGFYRNTPGTQPFTSFGSRTTSSFFP